MKTITMLVGEPMLGLVAKTVLFFEQRGILGLKVSTGNEKNSESLLVEFQIEDKSGKIEGELREIEESLAHAGLIFEVVSWHKAFRINQPCALRAWFFLLCGPNEGPKITHPPAICP